MGCFLTAFGRWHHSVIYKPFLYELRHRRRFRSRSARTTANGAKSPVLHVPRSGPVRSLPDSSAEVSRGSRAQKLPPAVPACSQSEQSAPLRHIRLLDYDPLQVEVPRPRSSTSEGRRDE